MRLKMKMESKRSKITSLRRYAGTMTTSLLERGRIIHTEGSTYFSWKRDHFYITRPSLRNRLHSEPSQKSKTRLVSRSPLNTWGTLFSTDVPVLFPLSLWHLWRHHWSERGVKFVGNFLEFPLNFLEIPCENCIHLGWSGGEEVKFFNTKPACARWMEPDTRLFDRGRF